MQLIRTALALSLVTLAQSAQAQVAEFDTTHSVYYEAPTRTHMFVYTPSASIQASPWSWLAVSAGWEADVVSGASVKTKAGGVYAAGRGPDVISTASVHDVRNLGRGEVTIQSDTAAFTAGYAYGAEHDYRSQALHLGVRADAFQHNTRFELSYAHDFDSVCDRVQSANANGPTQFLALESSEGCFSSAAGRITHPIAIDEYEASWTQSWTPVVATQLTYSAEVVDGFQSDPYRDVVLASGVLAQEHEPNERAREALTARVAWYLRSIRGALRLAVRGYHDTWAIDSVAAELEAEKGFGEALRLLVRGRVYRQSGAVFWSDDYTGGAPPLGPRGQFWTGDRELSPFTSWEVGLRAVWTIDWGPRRWLGVLEALKLAASANLANYSYDEYTLAGVPIDNARSYLGTLSLTASF